MDRWIMVSCFHQLNLIVEVTIFSVKEEAKAIERSREEDEVVSSMTLFSLTSHKITKKIKQNYSPTVQNQEKGDTHFK